RLTGHLRADRNAVWSRADALDRIDYRVGCRRNDGNAVRVFVGYVDVFPVWSDGRAARVQSHGYLAHHRISAGGNHRNSTVTIDDIGVRAIRGGDNAQWTAPDNHGC